LLASLGATQVIAGIGGGCQDGKATAPNVFAPFTMQCSNACQNPLDSCAIWVTPVPGGGTDESCVCDPTPGLGGSTDYSGDEYSEATGSLCYFELHKRPTPGGGTTYSAYCGSIDCPTPCVSELATDKQSGAAVLYCDCAGKGGSPFGGP